MIPSVDGRTPSVVWDDFFQRIGKNCKTISSVGWNDNLIILPQGFSTADILSHLTRSRGERYLLILNHLYFRGIYRKKTKKESGNYLPVHSDSLIRIGGNRYKALLDYGIKTAKHIIKSPKAYMVGQKCFEYRLNEEVLDFSRQQTYQLTIKAAVGVWQKRSDKQRLSFESRSPAHQKIARSVDGLRFNYTKAFDYVAGLTDSKEQSHRIGVLVNLMTDGQLWSVDKQNRNYTKLVVVPRKIRPFFSYLGSPLFAVDIKSSQPLLHSLLYSDNDPEKPKYLSVVQKDFWDFINKSVGSRYDISNPDEKELLKEKLFAQVFYGWKEEKPKPNAEYARAFEKEFPNLWKAIQDAKGRGNGPLPREMQFLEADQVMSVVGKLVSKPYPLITIHDCIVTTKDGVDDVRNGLLADFAQWNLVPSLTVKQVTA